MLERRRFRVSRLAVVPLLSVALAWATGPAFSAPAAAGFDPLEASIQELQVAMGSGRITSAMLVDYYLSRIQAFDQRGPALNAVATLDPNARDTASALDRERRLQGPRGPLHGIVVIVKDNFETRGMPTTAGSALLAGFAPDRDAAQVERLRAAGAVILGKANMHEFAYGITSVGSAFGAVRNPYDPTRNPGGSSGGTAAAVAANFATVGMGTDTCGSIRIPAAHNALVGLRGTQGLSSRRGLVPLSHTQDIAGPIARTVLDLAYVLDATAGFDPADEQTADSYGHIPESYARGLRSDALRGAKIGVLEDLLLVEPEDAEVAAVIGASVQAMRALGAEVRRVRIPGLESLLSTLADGFYVAVHDFKTDINAYLAANPDAPVRSLTDILSIGGYHEAIDTNLRLSEAMGPASDGDYLAELNHRHVLRQRILAVMAEQQLDVLAYPSIRRVAQPLGLDQPGSNCRLASNSGLPALTLPAGFTAQGLPVGLELLGPAWSEPRLLSLGYSFEQATHLRRAPLLAPGKTRPAQEPQEKDG